jgi:hypothetical protein
MFVSVFQLHAYQPATFYRNQVGVRFGVGDNTAPKMKIGYHIGVTVRAKHHTFEFHRENFGNIEIFQTSSYITLNGLFYGWTWAQRNAQFQLVAGGGSADYVFNHGSEVERGAGLYAETSISGLLNFRGNGVGLKLAGNINPMEGFFSATVFIQCGWAWKGNEQTDY